jgi:hypothetical protein
MALDNSCCSGTVDLFYNTGFIRGILRGVRYAKSLRVLFLRRRSPSWTTLVLYSRAVFIFNEPTRSLEPKDLLYSYLLYSNRLHSYLLYSGCTRTCCTVRVASYLMYRTRCTRILVSINRLKKKYFRHSQPNRTKHS